LKEGPKSRGGAGHPKITGGKGKERSELKENRNTCGTRGGRGPGELTLIAQSLQWGGRLLEKGDRVAEYESN